MTKFATTSRYPDFDTLVLEEDAKLALKYAKQILDMVEQAIAIGQDELSE